jgi:hypothetical protein
MRPTYKATIHVGATEQLLCIIRFYTPAIKNGNIAAHIFPILLYQNRTQMCMHFLCMVS